MLYFILNEFLSSGGPHSSQVGGSSLEESLSSEEKRSLSKLGSSTLRWLKKEKSVFLVLLIDISVSVPKTYLWFDENKISRIFYNLISNAIKYTDDGGEIIIKASVDKKYTTIDFIDNGFGIPEKEQKCLHS